MAWDDIDNISWLKQPSVTDAFAKASQASESLGRNFLTGFRTGMEKREQDVLLPLKVQQAQFQMAEAGLDIAGKQIAQQNEVETKAALVKLASAMSSIKNWASPESISIVDQIVMEQPVLRMTQPGQIAIKQAYELHQTAFDLKSKIEADKLRQQEMTDRETSRQKEISTREIALEKERQAGRLTIAKGRAIPSSVPEAARRITALEGQISEAENAGDAELYNALQTEKANNQKFIDQQSAPKGAAAKAPSFDIATGQLKTAAGDVALTTSNRTLAERVVTQANVAKQVIDELQRDISMWDIGPLGAVKNTTLNTIGLVAPGVGGSKAQDVYQNIKNLQGSINAMKTADRRGSIAELRAAGELIPKPGFSLESAGHARRNLDKLVANVLIPNARANAAQLGVRPPVWALTPEDILQAVKAGKAAAANGLSPSSTEFRSKFLTKTQGNRILEYYEANNRTMPNEVLE